MLRSIIIVLLIVCQCSFAQNNGQAAVNGSGPYALVAGGSKGIGFAIAEALARRGYNLILVARQVDGLIRAKEKIEHAYPVHVALLSYDLSKEESAEAIRKWCFEKRIPLKMLCNVAGYGGTKDYLSVPIDTLRYMVNLNIESSIVLTQMLLPLLEENAPSYVLNVSSMAGYAPIPDKNMYSASKSAVLFFSYGLRYQLKEKNISVSCLTPGPVFTKPSIVKDTKRQLGWIGMKMAVPTEKVGEKAVKKTLRGKMTITPGFLASVSARMIRLVPKRAIASFYYRVGKKNQPEPESTSLESVKK